MAVDFSLKKWEWLDSEKSAHTCDVEGLLHGLAGTFHLQTTVASSLKQGKEPCKAVMETKGYILRKMCVNHGNPGSLSVRNDHGTLLINSL